LDKTLETKLLFEISQIDKLLDTHKPLLDLCKLKIPDFIEMSATAMFLHSFYNGLENILKLIIKFYDARLPNDIKWHMDLLEAAFVSNENRKKVFRSELQNILEEHLKFRHFVRYSYGFQLEWERMEDLIMNINNTWNMAKEDINVFIKNN
jgi:uncharacterized membrane protein YheB (UPF0754 family)